MILELYSSFELTFNVQLNGGSLDGATLSVTSDVEHKDEEGADESTPIDQTDKPRAGSKYALLAFRIAVNVYCFHDPVAAEYIARGYKLSDNILQRAIEIDSKPYLS